MATVLLPTTLTSHFALGALTMRAPVAFCGGCWYVGWQDMAKHDTAGSHGKIWNRIRKIFDLADAQIHGSSG